MQYQILELKNPELELAQQQDQLDTYVGIIHSLDSPFHLYLNLSDLGSPSYIKLLIYSAGVKKEIIWGRYYVKTSTMNFEASCKYNLTQLNRFLATWRELGYEYIANSITDRITKTFRALSGSETLSDQEYRILKYAFALLENRISEEEFERYDISNQLPTILYKLKIDEKADFVDYEVLATQKDQIETAIHNVEAHLNRTDIDPRILAKVIKHQDLLIKIVNLFYKTIVDGPYNTNSFYKNLAKCEDENVCKNLDSEVCDIYEFLNESTYDFT